MGFQQFALILVHRICTDMISNRALARCIRHLFGFDPCSFTATPLLLALSDDVSTMLLKCRFFDNNEMAEKNPLQALVEEHKLKIKVDENIRQAYSNGWLKHSAWYVNGDGKPKMAKTNYEYKGGEQ